MISRRPPLLALGAAIPLLALLAGGPARADAPRALLVGTYNGIPGQFSSIQAAVNAAAPGDWVLVAPGDYHEKGAPQAGVYITTPGLHLRGMNRNTVIVDGTNPGGSVPCDPSPGLQDFGPKGSDGNPAGRNGVEAWKVDGVSIENLTACNFLSSDGGVNGNEIWWNGGDGSGQIGMHAFSGAYLNATSTYYKDSNTAQGKYGIFSSNEAGPGVIAYTYVSNMGDSAYYVGACPDCNVDLTYAHAQYSALGFSGTNAGGHLILENSEWDNNKAGLIPNTLNNDDWPSPADGACPGTDTGTAWRQGCTLIRNNYVHDNNNPNTPQFGIAGAAPVGAGIELSGTDNLTIVGNRVVNQGAWGIVIHDFPDTETPPKDDTMACRGGESLPGNVCYYVAFGNEVKENVLSHNGFFGNPSNGDLADDHQLHSPGNCWHDNTDTGGSVTSDPPAIQSLMGTCGQPNTGEQAVLTAELICASAVFGNCPNLPGATYPRTTATKMMPLPDNLATMPDPCVGAPANPWCPGGGASAATANAAASPAIANLPNTTALATSAATPAALVLLITAWTLRSSRRSRG